MKKRSYKTTSAILASPWFINKQWAEAHLPVIASLLKGNDITGSMLDVEDSDDDEDKAKNPVAVQTSAGVVYNVNYYTDYARIPEGAIAMINIAGPLMKYGGYCSYGAIDIARVITQVSNADNIKGLILNIDGPGGQVSGTSLLADTIKAVQKPTITMIDDGMAASAHMWVASAADEIYVTKETDQVGSVGVFCTLYDWNAYMEAQGLKVHEIYAPQSTEKNLDYKEALKGNYELLQEDLRVLADAFINTIKANRGDRLTSDVWNAGAMFYAKDAKKIGLIDGIKSFDQVILRMDEMISKNKSSNTKTKNMNFQKSAAIAKVEGFQPLVKGVAVEVEANSVAVPVEAMELIESSVVAAETAAASSAAELVKVNGELATANGTVGTLTAQVTTLTDSLATANDELATSKTRITELEAMGGKTESPVKAEDEFAAGKNDSKKYLTVYDKLG